MVNQLTEKIMSNIGLDVDGKFRVIDQDYGTLMIFDDKCLRCSYNNEEPLISKNDMYFNPMQNLKLMVFIFSYFIQKYQELTNTYIMTYCQLDNCHNETALDLKGTINITSNYYRSETLKYVDIIFRLSGYNSVDFLKKYDNQVR